MKVFFYLFLLSSLQTLALESVKPDKLIIFKKTPEIDLKLHTFYPKNYDKNKQYPVIIFFGVADSEIGDQNNFTDKLVIFQNMV